MLFLGPCICREQGASFQRLAPSHCPHRICRAPSRLMHWPIVSGIQVAFVAIVAGIGPTNSSLLTVSSSATNPDQLFEAVGSEMELGAGTCALLTTDARPRKSNGRS